MGTHERSPRRITGWSTALLVCSLTLSGRLPAQVQQPSQASTRTSAGDTAYALVAEARAAYREGSAEGFERSVLLFAEAQRLAQRAGDRRLLGLSLYGAGSAHAQLGRADSAIAYTRAALPLFRAAADRLGEASALGNMALSLKVTGYLDSALAYGREALALSRAIGDVRGEGIGLSTVASTFFDVGRADSAVAYFKAALPVWERYRSASSEAEAYAAQSEGQTLDNIGVTFIYRYLREPDSALRYMRRALAIWRGLGNRGAEGQTLLNIGYVFLTTANPDSALQYGRVRRDARADSALAYFRQALNLAREQGHAALENHARNNMIWPLVALGRSDEALALLRAALAGFRTQRDDFMVHGVQANMAAIYHRYATPPNFAAAVAYYDSAATWWHVARRRVGSEATTVRVTEQSIDSFEQWTLAALATHHAAPGRAALTSLSVTEHGRAQALLDLMRDTSRRAATRFGAEATDPSRALAYVRASGASVVEYLVTRDTLIIWFSGNGRDELRVSRVPIGRDSLARLVRGWRAALGADDAGLQPRLAARSAPTLEPEARRGITSHAGDGDYRALGAKLAELLLPAELRQQVQTELVVVPHGVLGLVPFAALPFGPAGTALSERVALRYGPSLAAVVFAEQRAGSRADPGRQTLAGSVVVGDPTMPAVLTESGKSARLAALPGAAAEAREVARRLGVTTLSGAAATEAEVRRRLSGAPVIHLATHGFAYASDARARLSFVALAPGEGHDGLLTVGEVLDEPALRLRADLVVLSACQTGLGDLKSAEGTVGLQRAFLAKGARSVLVTLWSVSDEATRLLMEKFYAHWLDDADKPSKAEALRRAQGDVRATKGFDHPRYWAAFQLVGAR